MPEPINLDDLDRRVIAALQVNARAPTSMIATVLDEQERTVGRRIDRLLVSGTVRLTAFVDDLRTGTGYPMSLRITVRPGATDAVAQELCSRPDARTIVAVTGDADLTCELVAADQHALHALLTTELPKIPGVLRTRTYTVLRHVKPTSEWRLPVLMTRQTAELRNGAGPRRDGYHVDLSAADHELLDELRVNARLSFVALGDRLGVTSTTVRRRLDRLLASGAVALRAWVEPVTLGLAVEAGIWLRVRPDALERISAELGFRTDVTYCSVIAGAYGLEVLVAVPDLAHLYAFSEQVIANEPDILDSDLTLTTRVYKRGGLLIADPGS